MSEKKTGRFFTTYNLVLLGIFAAILLLLSFTPLGYLKIGIIEISFLAIPVAICACYLGKWGGLILGTIFGLTSFFQCLGYSAFGTALMGINGFYTFIVCVVSRVLMGFLAGLIADAFRSEKPATRHIKYVVVSIATPVMNTLFFCGLLALLFGKIPVTIGDMEINVITAVVVPAVTLNGIVEAVAGAIIGTAVCEAIYPLYRRARK
ncbi:MAG: ECF transporter S component [Clostridia bacterium]|nr:ECF transporter S component [Clostridia bacterium]